MDDDLRHQLLNDIAIMSALAELSHAIEHGGSLMAMRAALRERVGASERALEDDAEILRK